MIFNHVAIKILDFNKKAKQISAVRFDKGSPSPIIPSSVHKLLLKEFTESINGFLNNYPHEEGFNPLIDLIQKIELTTNRRRVDKNQICLTNGALSALFYLLASLLNKKDAVILNDLSFEGFTSVIKTLGLNSICVNFGNKRELENYVKRLRPKVLILNSPENPSGKIYQEDFLRFLGFLAKKYNLLIVSDEVNNQNVYSPYTFMSPSLYIPSRYLVTINSFSKNYFLPGLRLGWIVSDKNIIRKINNILITSQVGVSHILQIIAYTVIARYEREIEKYKKGLEKKKIHVEKVLVREGIKFLKPVMAGSVFFIYVDVDSQKLANYLLNKHRIAVIPGTYFGKKWKKWIRLGFGTVSNKDIKEKIPLIKEAQQSLKEK